MTASYSASLLEVRNQNLSAYLMSIPSGEVRIRPAPQRVSRRRSQSLFGHP